MGTLGTKKKKNPSVTCDLCRPLLVAGEHYRCTDTKDDSSAPTKHITVRHVLTKNITTNKIKNNTDISDRHDDL